MLRLARKSTDADDLDGWKQQHLVMLDQEAFYVHACALLLKRFGQIKRVVRLIRLESLQHESIRPLTYHKELHDRIEADSLWRLFLHGVTTAQGQQSGCQGEHRKEFDIINVYDNITS